MKDEETYSNKLRLVLLYLSRVLVGVQPQGLLAVGLGDVLLGCRGLHAQHQVVVDDLRLGNDFHLYISVDSVVGQTGMDAMGLGSLF